jgi:hypothetical protein
MGTYLGLTSYYRSSNYFINFCLLLVGLNSLPGYSISSWGFCNGVYGSSFLVDNYYLNLQNFNTLCPKFHSATPFHC